MSACVEEKNRPLFAIVSEDSANYTAIGKNKQQAITFKPNNKNSTVK